MNDTTRITEAIQILHELGLPRAQQNIRSALCLLALLDLTSDKTWAQSTNPLIGITPIMHWARQHFQKNYAPNTRETIRRHSIHQFVAAGLVLSNPDDPARPVNSPKTVYQIESETLALLRSFNDPTWKSNLAAYLQHRATLIERYARVRSAGRIPVRLAPGREFHLSPGAHNQLIKSIIEDFAPRFVPGCQLIYAGDTKEKWGYFDQALLEQQGVSVNSHGKMPDVVLYDAERNWLILVESVSSHGPVDSKRHEELIDLFNDSTAGLVFVTAFPNRSVMAKYLGKIAWETEVWVADAPSHLVHFDGSRFLGPYQGA